MRTLTLRLMTVAIAAAALLAGPSAGVTTPPSFADAAEAKPVCWKIFLGACEKTPESMVVSSGTGSGTFAVSDMTDWRRWGEDRAHVMGIASVKTCRPSCAEGGTENREARIVLSHIRSDLCGQRRYMNIWMKIYDKPRTWNFGPFGSNCRGAQIVRAYPHKPKKANLRPPTVQVSKTKGVLKVASLRVGPRRGKPGKTLADAIWDFGPPRWVRRPYRESCNAYFGRGLMLTATSFGGEYNCKRRWIQAATVSSRKWKVRVGKRKYRVGMPKRRLPKRAKRVPRYGYQLASIRTNIGFGGRTGVAFARVGSKGRIASFYFYIGGAGD